MAETHFQGPIRAGNVLQSDGTNNLASSGGYNGTANVGYAVMVQSEAITQATNGSVAGVYTTNIVVPADSQILSINLLVSTAWTGTVKTLEVGSSASATAFTVAAAGNATNKGILSIVPGTDDTAIANWRDVGATDVKLVVTSTNTGSGVGVLTVTYVQSNNLT